MGMVKRYLLIKFDYTNHIAIPIDDLGKCADILSILGNALIVTYNYNQTPKYSKAPEQTLELQLISLDLDPPVVADSNEV
jgi:hypothetical protein